jgi:DNA-binding MarR family transcriptional regulator
MIARVQHERRSLLFEIYVAGQLVNELVAREFVRRRLKVGPQVLLTQVARSGPITPSELERLTGLRPSTLRERMQPLLDGDFVRRLPSSEDRRSHTLEVTDRGRELLDATEPAVRDAERNLEAQLERPLDEYRQALEAIVKAGQAALDERSAETALD